jgi:hypothetical protein
LDVDAQCDFIQADDPFYVPDAEQITLKPRHPGHWLYLRPGIHLPVKPTVERKQ